MKRWPHLRHSRRRRMAASSRADRESITLSSTHSHFGHFILQSTNGVAGVNYHPLLAVVNLGGQIISRRDGTASTNDRTISTNGETASTNDQTPSTGRETASTNDATAPGSDRAASRSGPVISRSDVVAPRSGTATPGSGATIPGAPRPTRESRARVPKRPDSTGFPEPNTLRP